MYENGTAGDEAKKRISLPPKAGEISEFLLFMLQSISNVILTATAFRNEFQPVGFLMDLNLSGFPFITARLLLRLGATLSIETSSTCSTWSAIFWSSQNFPAHFVISQNETLFQISRYPLSCTSRFGINHTQWHRLFPGKRIDHCKWYRLYQKRHRPLKMASLVYERENCVGAS